MNSLPDRLAALLSVDLSYAAPLELRRMISAASQKKSSPAAVCLLFNGPTFEQAKILLTERSPALPTHAGQVAFPGGTVEPSDGGDLAQTALRESQEETGISAKYVKIVGRLPEFPTLTGGFEVFPYLGYWNSDSEPKLAQNAEVIVAEWVSVMDLFSTRKTEIHLVQDVEIKSPVFMWGERKMWGVSAWIFDLIYARYGTLKL